MEYSRRKVVSVDTKAQRSQNASLWHYTSNIGGGADIALRILNFNNLVAPLEIAV